jgi:hypothetical protein
MGQGVIIRYVIGKFGESGPVPAVVFLRVCMMISVLSPVILPPAFF